MNNYYNHKAPKLQSSKAPKLQSSNYKYPTYTNLIILVIAMLINTNILSAQTEVITSKSDKPEIHAPNCLSWLPYNWRDYLPEFRNELGEIIEYDIPPDSSYVPGELIIRFRKQAVYLDSLCYTVQVGPFEIDKDGKPIKKKRDEIQSAQLRTDLMNQRFPVEELVVNPMLAMTMKNFGADTLRRMTVANPCRDTLSVSRNGDTLICEDYLWLVLEFEQDSCLIDIAILLTMLFQSELVIAEPNYYCSPAASIPNDEFYATHQTSLNMLGMATAWDYTKGNYNIRVGIVDNGVDYRHPDLGNGLSGSTKKVALAEPFHQWENYVNSWHGTSIAGIIGGLTNNSTGIAGIVGGWNTSTDDIGVALYSYKVGYHSPGTLGAARAIREASRCDPDPDDHTSIYGFCNHIINNSFTLGSVNFEPPDPELDDPVYYNTLAMQTAIQWASKNGVSFVAARGNYNDDSPRYPACFFPSKVISVGASGQNSLFSRVPYDEDWDTRSDGLQTGSCYGQNMDFIAPGHQDVVYTTTYLDDNPPTQYTTFYGTSAATAYASGVVALLRSYAYEQDEFEQEENKKWNHLRPEDYEGILKASALDLIEDHNTDDDYYVTGYDEKSGWGHLRADWAFNMIINLGYRISHHSTNQNLTFDDWSEESEYVLFHIEGHFYSKDDIEEVPDLLPSGTYRVKYRKVSGTLTLPNDKWLVNYSVNPLFIWQISLANEGGFSIANPNFQDRHTYITSNQGGLDNVIGIQHNFGEYEYEVEAYTYQYALVDEEDEFILDEFSQPRLYPPTNQLALTVSVFGRELEFVSVKDQVLKTDEYEINLYPNPASSSLNFNFVSEMIYDVSISIYDILGKKLIELPQNQYGYGINSQRIDISGLINGTYTFVINVNGTLHSKIFTVLRN